MRDRRTPGGGLGLRRQWLRLPALLRGAVLFVVPLGASWLPLCYIRAIHQRLLFGEAQSLAWVFLPGASLLVFELAATRLFEVRRHGWQRHVVAGLAVRCLSLVAQSYLFFWATLKARGTPDIYTPLIRMWPYLAHICWQASPLPAAFAGAIILVLYGQLTVRRRLFRFSTTVLLPTLATFLLFRLFYFHPASPLRTLGRRRAVAVERVVPQSRYAGFEQAFGAKRFRFSRDLYVHPDDAWVMASFSATFTSNPFGWPDNNDQPNLFWADLRGTGYEVFRSDSVRWFSSECPARLYFAPWNVSRMFEYEPGAPRCDPSNCPRASWVSRSKRYTPFTTPAGAAGSTLPMTATRSSLRGIPSGGGWNGPCPWPESTGSGWETCCSS